MGRLDLRDPVRDEDKGVDLVCFEVLRERRRQWIRAKHRDGTRTPWRLLREWSESLREDILAELDQLRARAT